jgi:hypothetical protein
MKKVLHLIAIVSAVFVSASMLAQADKKDAAPQKAKKAPPLPGAGTGGATPHATTSAVIGPNRNEGGMITLTYGRPYRVHPRKGGEPRKIWGGLVPWGKADRLGADEATLFITQRDIDVGGTTVPAGAYTLYIVPSETGTSKLAFSKNIGKWGVPVDEKNDLARVDLKKEKLSQPVDQLTLSVENVPQGSMNGVLKIQWDDTQFSMPFTLKK